MELKRDQIIKALECCASEEYVCAQCPIDEKIKDDCECGKLVAKNALSLIKELTAENKLLNVELGNANSEILRLIDREKELTVENERLHASCTEFTQNLHECKADTVRKMHSELYEEFLKVARCQKSGEPNMTSQEVLAILKRKSIEMEEGKI